MAKRVTLGAKLDSAAADGLRAQLMKASEEDVILDGSAVELLGGLCLELLLSAESLWTAKGLDFALDAASDQLLDNLTRLGLADHFVAEGAAA